MTTDRNQVVPQRRFTSRAKGPRNLQTNRADGWSEVDGLPGRSYMDDESAIIESFRHGGGGVSLHVSPSDAARIPETHLLNSIA